MDRNLSTDVFLHIGTFLEGAPIEIQKFASFASPYYSYVHSAQITLTVHSNEFFIILMVPFLTILL